MGVPFSALVEKAMETQGKELFSQIVEVVNALQKAKPSHSQGGEDMSKDERKTVKDSHKPGLEFDLPIDLPGLLPSANKKESAKKDSSGFKKEGVSSEFVSKMPRNKSKPTDVTSKSGGGASKLKTDGKPHVEAIKDTKKEKESGSSKLVSDGKKLQKLKKTTEEITDKIEGPGKLAKEHVSVEWHGEKDTKGGTLSTESAEKTELRKDSKVVKESCSDSSPIQGKEKDNISLLETAEIFSEDEQVKQEKRKSLYPRKGSSRIPSCSDDQKMEGESDHSENTQDFTGKRYTDDKQLEEKRAKKHRNRSEKIESNTLSQKKVKAFLNSSSDESIGRSCSPEKMEMYTSKRPGSLKRSRRFDLDYPIRHSREKRAKTLSRTVSPASTSSNASGCTIPLVKDARRKHRKPKVLPHPSSRSNRDRSGSPTRSPPPLVTRSNRHVKRNRRFYPSEEDELVDDRGDSGVDEKSTKRKKISRWN